jgi:hypothetical protein
MKRKIWNLQDSTENRIKIRIQILFESGADTWHVIIHWYRFVWITPVSRWI